MTVFNTISHSTMWAYFRIWLFTKGEDTESRVSVDEHGEKVGIKCIFRLVIRYPLLLHYRTRLKHNVYKGLLYIFNIAIGSAGFPYRLNRLKSRASKFRRPPAKVYNIFNTVIGLFHSCCHKVVYFLNNPSVIFLTQLHSISENCRILDTHHHLRLYSNWLNTLPSSSSREGGELGVASQVE